MEPATVSVKSKRIYKKRGYVSAKVFWGGVEMHSAYSWPDLYYIGNSVNAYRLWKKFGIIEFYPASKYEQIKPLSKKEKTKNMLVTGSELPLKNSPVCSIGWSERDKKWYGWSHRAIYGFTVGSKVEKGDCGYMPSGKQDTIDEAISFWSDEYKNVRFLRDEARHGVDGFWLERVYNDSVPNEKMRGQTKSTWFEYPETWDRGEWTAVTWEDAKQMAIDFAEGVG